MSVLLFGAAATGGTAATTGLIGTAGAFSAGTAAVTAGVAVTAAAAIKQGQIAESQGKFAEQIALRNQQALERQGKAEQVASEIEEERITRKEKFIKAAQRAAVGKSGIGLAGATLNILTDTAFQFSLDRNLALRRGLIAKQGLFERGAITGAQGRFARDIGKQRRRTSFIRAGGSILARRV